MRGVPPHRSQVEQRVLTRTEPTSCVGPSSGSESLMGVFEFHSLNQFKRELYRCTKASLHKQGDIRWKQMSHAGSQFKSIENVTWKKPRDVGSSSADIQDLSEQLPPFPKQAIGLDSWASHRIIHESSTNNTYSHQLHLAHGTCKCRIRVDKHGTPLCYVPRSEGGSNIELFPEGLL